MSRKYRTYAVPPASKFFFVIMLPKRASCYVKKKQGGPRVLDREIEIGKKIK